MALAGCLRCISVHGLSFTISLFPLLGVVYLVSMLHVLLNADVVNNRKPERSSASNRSLACAGSSTKLTYRCLARGPVSPMAWFWPPTCSSHRSIRRLLIRPGPKNRLAFDKCTSTKFSNTQEDYAALRANQLSGSSG